MKSNEDIEYEEAEKDFRKDSNFLTWLLLIPFILSFWSKFWGAFLLGTYAVYHLIELKRVIQSFGISIIILLNSLLRKS